MKTKNEYIEILAAELRDLSAQIDRLSVGAENATESVKLDCADGLDSLRVKQRAAVEKMQELEAHGDEAWDELKETANTVWHDLRTGLANAAAKFK